MKLFEKVNMASETIDAAMRSGIVYSAANAEVEANPGDLVTNAGLVNSSVYTGKKDLNTIIFKAPAAGERNLFILDPIKVPEATNDDLVYRMGVRTLGLKGAKGEVVAARKLFLNDMFELGLENIGENNIANVTIGDTYGLSAGNFEHAKVEADARANADYLIRVEDKVKKTQGVGTVGTVDAVLVTVIKL